MNLGNLSLDRHDYVTGASQSREALARFKALGNTWDLADAFDFLAANIGAQGAAEKSGRIFGASEALRAAIGAVRSPLEQQAYDRFVDAALAAGDPQVFDAAWAAGRAMTLEDIVAYSLQE